MSSIHSAMYKQLLRLSSACLFPWWWMWAQIWAPTNSLYHFPLMTHHEAGMFICSRRLPWVLQLGCSSFSISEEKNIGSITSLLSVIVRGAVTHRKPWRPCSKPPLLFLTLIHWLKAWLVWKNGSNHAGNTMGRDVAQILTFWVTSSRGISSISQGYFCALPARFLGLWPASSAGEWEAYHVSDFPGYAFSNCAGILPRWI